MRHMEVNRSRQEEPSQVDFFVLNYSMSAFKAKYRDGMNMEKVRINFAPHAFMFEGCQPGDTRQVNIHVALYTPQNSASPSFSFDPNLHGIEECNPSDIGRIAVNPADFLCQNTLMEIHLHPVDNSGQMAVSPNNGAFLLNLTLPIVNFTIVMLHQTERGINKLSVLNISFLNDESLADCAILCALNSEMLLQSIITNSDDQEKNEDLEFVYLKRLKCAIETGVVSKLGNQSFLNSLFDEQQIRQLYHRKIWLTLGCPRIDDIGGKVHRELDLNWRINDFKRSLLTDTLIEDIFKTHQALLAYGESKLEYQNLSIELPISNPEEEEKHPENEGRPSSTSAQASNQKLAQLTNQVELHMELLLSTEGYNDEVKQSFEALPACIQDLIAYRVWVSFGKIEGVHNDFGRHSYLHLPGQLNEAYFARPDIKIQIVCTLLDEIRTL